MNKTTMFKVYKDEVNNIIISNQVECLLCGDKPFSAHHHDFKSCKCGNVAVDGGADYLKRTGKRETWKELSIVIAEDSLNNILDTAQEMVDTGRNTRGVVYGILRQLHDEGLLVN